MKTPNPKPQQIPRLALATAMGIETLQLMKSKLTTLLIVLCSTLVTTAVFGQVTYIWIGPSGGDLATTNNWNPNGTPSGPNSDTMEFNGQTVGPVAATSNTGTQTGFSGGNWGLGTYLTANQVNSVTFYTTVANAASPGIRMNGITLDSGAGSLQFGVNSTTNALDTVWGGAAGGIHTWANNSANPVIICPDLRLRYGGGGAHTLVFGGTGNWVVTNYLITANTSPTIVQKTGSGTMSWTAGNNAYSVGNSSIQSPEAVNGGTLILHSSGLLSSQNIADNDGSIPALLEYDAAAQSQTLSGTISDPLGNGPNPLALQVNNGTLTLSSANSSFHGNITLSGGELIAGGADNGSTGPLGTGGTITFTGGTLGFSVNNTYDYSPRFDTSASQAYSFDTGGQSVTFATALASSGGTLAKGGPGTLTLVGTNTYSGNTTISAGKLVFAGPMTGSGNISVADSTALGVTATNAQVTPGTLTLGTSSGCTLEFNNVNSTTTAIIAAGTLSSAGTVTININSGALAPGNSYPLFTWTSGSAPTVSLGILNGFIGSLSTVGNSIKLNITATAYLWSGANNGNWDTTTPNNWVQNGGPVIYGANGAGPALFDDTAAGNFSVTVNSPVTSTLLTVNNSANAYSIASSGANNIGGSTPLTKNGSSTLTLSGGANAYTGVTTLSGGTVSVSALANGGSASDIGAAANSAANLVLNGGTLQYTGAAASVDRLFTLGTGGGTIDSSGTGALNLNNAGSVAYSGTGVRGLTLTGTDVDANTFAAVLANNGGATTLAKSGAGNWILTGNNTYSGVTTIANGSLQIGAGGASGSPGSGSIVDSGVLVFNRSGTLTVNSVISGNGSVTNMGSGTVILAANNTYQGGTTNGVGATLQIGNGGATGSLYINGPIDNEGTLIFNNTSQFIYTGNGLISGAGNVIVSGSGDWVKAIGANSYTGWTLINAGATFQPCDGNTGQFLSSVVTNNGTLEFVRQDDMVFYYSNNIVGSGQVVKENNNFNSGDATLLGTNTYTGGTLIRGGGIILGDGGTPGWGSIVGNVTFTNSAVDDRGGRFLEFFRPDNYTFSGNIIGTTVATTGLGQGDLGSVRQIGPNVVTLTGNNTYQGGTIISNGVLQVGNGGTTGSIGSSNVTDESVLAFNRSDIMTFSGGITGTGLVVQAGSGTLTLSGALSLIDTNLPVTLGAITVSNGTLVLNPAGGNVSGNVNVSGGTLVPTAVGTVSTLTLSNNLNITSGTVSATLNKSLSPSNSVYSVVGTVNASGGTLAVHNYGPALQVGDKFIIFNQAVTGGAGMTITGGGANWVNNLAVDGSISVSSLIPPPKLSYALTGGGSSLQFSWTGSAKLQSQTNSLNKGISSNWGDYPGGGSSPVTVSIVKTNPTVFFRLVTP